MRNTALRIVLLFACMATVDCGPTPPTLPSNEPLLFKIENLEQVSPTNNLAVPGYAPAAGMQAAWGLLHVSAIDHGVVITANAAIGDAGTRFYADDGPGGMTGQITGILYGLQIASPTTWTGGTIDLFWHDTNATYIAANCISGNVCAPDAAAVGLFTAGTFLVRLKLANGIDPANSQTFRTSNVPIAALSAPGAFGVFAGFADVDPAMSGAWTAALDGNWFMTPLGAHDMQLRSTVTNQSNWSGNPSGAVGLRSADPIVVFTH
jgi:hypothetical protein